MVTSLAALAAANVSTDESPFSTRKKLAKSTPPSASPIGGMITSLTREVTMPVKDAPMITPTARSRTLPRTANFLNSSNMFNAALLKCGARLMPGADANKRIEQPQEQPRRAQAADRADAVGDEIENV